MQFKFTFFFSIKKKNKIEFLFLQILEKIKTYFRKNWEQHKRILLNGTFFNENEVSEKRQTWDEEDEQ